MPYVKRQQPLVLLQRGEKEKLKILPELVDQCAPDRLNAHRPSLGDNGCTSTLSHWIRRALFDALAMSESAA